MPQDQRTTVPAAAPDPRRIRKIAESIINLPTLPTVVSKMIDLVDNPKTSAGSLARLISTDQALTARILKLANSAYYGLSREVSTVNMAIVVLGFNTVKDMGLSLSVLDMFKDTDNRKFFDAGRFWEHSIGCGIASRLLARKFRNKLAGEAFVAGLLHDIGKVVLKQYCAPEFGQIMHRVWEKDDDLEQAELETIGTGHGQVGGWLAVKWNLPGIIADSITHHHAPWEAATDKAFVSLVNLADYLCHVSAIGNSGRKTVKPVDTRIWEILQGALIAVGSEDIDGLVADLLLEFDRSETFLSFIQDET